MAKKDIDRRSFLKGALAAGAGASTLGLGGVNGAEAATSDKPAVRRRAVVALAAFEGPAVEAAWARARHDRDREVRDAVDELLGPAEEDAEVSDADPGPGP